METITIDHALIDMFHDRVAYARAMRRHGIVVCTLGHEIPIREYPAWCDGRAEHWIKINEEGN